MFRVSHEAMLADSLYWDCHTTLPSISIHERAARQILPGREASRPEPKLPELHVITYATKSTKLMCDSLLVALAAGTPFIL